MRQLRHRRRAVAPPTELPMAKGAGSSQLRPPRLLVGVDLRCLDGDRPRGFARYVTQLTAALALRPGVSLLGVTRPGGQGRYPFATVCLGPGREMATEQLRLPWLAYEYSLDVLWSPANRGLPLLAPCPTVLTLHDMAEWDPEVVEAPRGRDWLRFSYASAFSLASASLIITVSEASARAIERRLCVGRDRLRVIPEAADERFHREVEPGRVDEVCRAHGLQPGFVLYVGGFDRKKDVATLVRAYALLGPARPQLVLVGRRDGDACALESLARSLGVQSSVRWLGFVDDDELIALYRAASSFVLPAVAEGFGLPAIEAMASGTPTIVADAASLPEVVGQGGQLFRAGDHVQLAGLLSDVVRDPSLRARWAHRASDRSSSFSWHTAAAETELAFRDAVSTPRSMSSRLRDLRHTGPRLAPSPRTRHTRAPAWRWPSTGAGQLPEHA